MNQSEYYRAAVPEPWTILGLRLRPFSAGHLILLHRAESAFAIGGEASFEDLAFAVFICSQTFESAVKCFSDPDLPKLMRAWHKKLTNRGLFRKPRTIDLFGKSEEFRSYMDEGCKYPDYIYKGGTSDIGDVPAVQFVKAFLLSRTSMTESEFLNRPWALSIWDFLTIQSQEGHVRLCNEETIADAQAAAANVAKLIAEGKFQWQTKS